jgi:hypothetical protein
MQWFFLINVRFLEKLWHVVVRTPLDSTSVTIASETLEPFFQPLYKVYQNMDDQQSFGLHSQPGYYCCWDQTGNSLTELPSTVRSCSWHSAVTAMITSMATNHYTTLKNIYSAQHTTIASATVCSWNWQNMLGGAWVIFPPLTASLFHPAPTTSKYSGHHYTLFVSVNRQDKSHIKIL